MAVDNAEWDSLYYDPSKKGSPHRVQEGTAVEVQLWVSSKHVLWYCNGSDSQNELAYLGIDRDGALERTLTMIRNDSNLCFFSGLARRITSRVRKLDPRKQTVNILLDCGLPIVLIEEVSRNKASKYVQKEDEYLIGICPLWGSIAFSNSVFQAPVTGKVKKITPLKVIPPSTLLEIELQPSRVVPDIRISYHAKPLEKVDLSQFLLNS